MTNQVKVLQWTLRRTTLGLFSVLCRNRLSERFVLTRSWAHDVLILCLPPLFPHPPLCPSSPPNPFPSFPLPFLFRTCTCVRPQKSLINLKQQSLHGAKGLTCHTLTERYGRHVVNFRQRSRQTLGGKSSIRLKSHDRSSSPSLSCPTVLNLTLCDGLPIKDKRVP